MCLKLQCTMDEVMSFGVYGTHDDEFFSSFKVVFFNGHKLCYLYVECCLSYIWNWDGWMKNCDVYTFEKKSIIYFEANELKWVNFECVNYGMNFWYLKYFMGRYSHTIWIEIEVDCFFFQRK